MNRLQTLLCLDFGGQELEDVHWQQIDRIIEKRILINKSELTMQADVDGLLVKLGARIDRKTLDLLPNLQYIGMFGTGYGGIDMAAAHQRGITVTNLTDYATEGVAEFTFAILLEYLRDIAHAQQAGRQSDYGDTGYRNQEIKGKTFGVIGAGHIGRRTAELAQAFGADVVYWSAHRKQSLEKRGITYVPLETLLRRADVVTLNLAHNPQTDGFLTGKRLLRLQPGAILINTSPMDLIELAPLEARLKRQDLTLLLDHADEMNVTDAKRLSRFENCRVYPPIAYLTDEATYLKKQLYVDNLKNFLNGKPTNKVS